MLVALLPGSAGAIGVANTWVGVGDIPAGHSTAAQATPFYASSKNVFFASDASGVYRSVDGGDTFLERNAGLVDLRVSRLAVSPRFEFDLLLFASTPTGLFRSTDAAASWTKLTAGLPDIGVTGVAFAPAFEANQTVFAATDGFGVYKSSDAGVSWHSLSSAGLTRTDLQGVQVAPGGSGHTIIVVWSESRVYRSDDSGANWAEKNSGLPGGRVIRFIILGPGFGSNGLAFLGTKGHGVYKTTNKGNRWSSAGLSGKGGVETVAFSPNYGIDNLIFAGTDAGGFFRSTNRGGSWKESNEGLARHSVTSISSSNDFRSDKTLFAGGGQGGIFRSTDGGDNWKEIGSGLVTARVATVGFSNNYHSDGTLLVGTQSGVLKSDNRGATWSNINWNLPNASVQTMKVSPGYADDGTIFVGLADSGVHRTFKEAGKTWIKQDSGLEGNPLNDNPLTVATSPVFHNTKGDLTVFVGGAGGLARSVLAGGQWVHVFGVASSADVTSVVLSPNYAADGTVFAASSGTGVFKGAARGQSWNAVNNGLGNLVVRQLAISPFYFSDSTLLAATDGGVFVTRDGGQVWNATSITQAASGVGLAPDFASSRMAFASLAGFGGAVMQSFDGGVNWHPITTGLPNTEILALEVSPDFANDRNVFVGTSRHGLLVYWAAGGIPAPTVAVTPAVATPAVTTPVSQATPVSVAVSSIGSATVISNLYVVDPSGANDELKHNVPNLSIFVDGQTLVAEFKRHFESTGGIERWGLPISEVFEEQSGSLTQYYQRGVVDFHKRDDLGGIWVTERRLAWDYMGGGAGGSVDMGVEPNVTSPSEGQLVGPWGHKISDFDITGQFVGFRQFFDRFGGANSFGYPKTDARVDTGASGMLLARGASLGRVRQYFQAAVMEFFPDNPEEFRVQLTLLGDFLRDLTYPNESWRSLGLFSGAQDFEAGSTVRILAVR